MNKTYNLIWNAVQQTWVVTSELGKARKKAKTTKIAAAIITLLGAVTLNSTLVHADPAPRALPSLNNIASGNATLVTATGSLTVNQTTDKLIANWNSFDVGVNSKVTFNQPNASSIALNRVSGAAPSEIFGRVNANGQLILVNPAGLTFGAAAQVNAASVIASTLDITDANFLADTLKFDRGTATGTINNQGIILANEGNTYVFASNINNSGTIRAKAGNVNIANGNRLTVNSSAGTATLNQVSGIAGVITSIGILRGDRLTTTDKGKVYLIGDRARNGSMVNLAGELTSTGNDIKGKIINITGNTSLNANSNLNSTGNIHIDGVVSVSGNNRLISLNYDTSAGNHLYFGAQGKFDLLATSRFRDNNEYYTVISTLAALQAIGETTTALTGKYVLGADIDASSTALNGFTPIGSRTFQGLGQIPFSGELSGLGHTVDGLTINLPNQDRVALIGYSRNGKIRGLKLDHINIQGAMKVGGLIGEYIQDDSDYAAATTAESLFISNNAVSGSIRASSNAGGIAGLYISYHPYSKSRPFFMDANSVNVDASGTLYVGGLAGRVINANQALLINNNHSNASITGNSHAGGLIGELASHLVPASGTTTVQDNWVSGQINGGGATATSVSNIGGAIGSIWNPGYLNQSNNVSRGGSIIIDHLNSHANVSITAPASVKALNIGGLIGGINAPVADPNALDATIIRNSSSTGSVSGFSGVGGLIGKALWVTISNNNASSSVSGMENVGGLIGYSSDSSISNNIASGNVLALSGATGSFGGLIGYNQGMSRKGVDGTKMVSPISANHANGQINASSLSSSTGAAGGLIGFNTDAPVTGNSASGLVTSYGYAGGLIGYNLYNGPISTVSELFLSGMSMTDNHASGNTTSLTSSAGGLVGVNMDTIIINSHASGHVQAVTAGGGLVGVYTGGAYPSGSSSIFSLNKITNSFASGNVSGTGMMGGLIGQADVPRFSLSQVYASGQATSTQRYAGGLVGYFSSSAGVTQLTDSYATGQVEAAEAAGGLVGYLRNSSNYTNTTGFLYIGKTYASNQVTSSNGNAGGLIGQIVNYGQLSLASNYWNMASSGLAAGIGSISGYGFNAEVDNLKGLTAAQSKIRSSYAGWDIGSTLNSNSIWYINHGVSSPVLRNLMTP